MSFVRSWGCVSFHSPLPSLLTMPLLLLFSAVLDEKFACAMRRRVNKKSTTPKMPKEVCVMLHLIVAISPLRKGKRYFWIPHNAQEIYKALKVIMKSTMMLLLQGFKSGWLRVQ